MARIIKANGEELAVEPKNGYCFSLEEMQAVVGGYIEVVYFDDGRLMVVNEEGKLQNMPFNALATELACSMCKYFGNDWIAGDVLVCDGEQVI